MSNTIRFVFAIGGASRPNTHMAYWVDAQERLGDYRYGWWPQSTEIQVTVLDVTDLSEGNLSLEMEILAPDGTALATECCASAESASLAGGRVLLPEPGTYRLVFRDFFGTRGTGTYRFQLD